MTFVKKKFYADIFYFKLRTEKDKNISILDLLNKLLRLDMVNIDKDTQHCIVFKFKRGKNKCLKGKRQIYRKCVFIIVLKCSRSIRICWFLLYRNLRQMENRLKCNYIPQTFQTGHKNIYI